MCRVLVFSSVILILLTCLSEVITLTTCPSNEEFNNCTQAICRALDCSQKDQPVACAAIAEGSCKSGCVCQPGYLRTAHGDCISENRCSGTLVCSENETVNTCPGDCVNDYCPTSEDDEVSSVPNSDPDSCGPPACTCRFNYMRNQNDDCIPTRECPSFDCSARPNEEFNPCPPLCPTDDCSQASPDGRCPSRFGFIGIVLPCKPKCRCIKGYWRSNGICVPYAQCQKDK